MESYISPEALHVAVPKGFKGGAYFGVEKPNAEVDFNLKSAAQPIKWSEYIIPSDDQGKEQSCVGRSWAGWLEAMIRYTKGMNAIPKNKQIDASRIYKNARDLWWGGNYDDGLYIHQGFYSMIDLGVIPVDTKLFCYKSTYQNLQKIVATSPIVVGHTITEGWFTTLPNGCINHTLQGKYALGGHAILEIGCIKNSDQDAVLFQNSWGEKWGFNGLGIMNSEYWYQTVDNVFYTAQFGSKWKDFKGYEKFLIPA